MLAVLQAGHATALLPRMLIVAVPKTTSQVTGSGSNSLELGVLHQVLVHRVVSPLVL